MDNAIKYTSLCFLLFVIGAIIMLTYKNSEAIENSKYISCFTSYGETKNIILNDGTNAILRPGSILLYSDKLSEKKRMLYLKGEALLDVSIKEPPLILSSGCFSIVALPNSSFAINSFNEDSIFTILPFKGEIKFIGCDGKTGRNLPLNVRVEINRNNGEMNFFRTSDYKNELYKNGCMVFQNERLEYIVNSLIRNYCSDLNYDSSKYGNGRYTVTFFPYSNLSESIDILCNIIGTEVFY